jgi:hypothetical protein
MTQLYSNNAISTLSAGIGTSDTTLFIQGAHGSRFPVVTGGNVAKATLEDASGNIEIVAITAHSSGSASLTVVRAQEGTTARAFIIGDLVEMRLTAAALTAFEVDIDALFALKGDINGENWTGTHDFTAADAVGLPAATFIGGVSAAEISYLDGVTSSIQAQLNAKGAIGGQVWTGVHAFPTTTSIGPVTDTEISYLDGVTSSIQSQLNARGLIAGQAWTGTHAFSGTVTVPTMPNGTNDGNAASTQFVNNVAFSSFANLPGDPGDDVIRVLATQAGNKSWREPPASDVAQYLAGIY